MLVRNGNPIIKLFQVGDPTEVCASSPAACPACPTCLTATPSLGHSRILPSLSHVRLFLYQRAKQLYRAAAPSPECRVDLRTSTAFEGVTRTPAKGTGASIHKVEG